MHQDTYLQQKLNYFFFFFAPSGAFFYIYADKYSLKIISKWLEEYEVTLATVQNQSSADKTLQLP